MPGEKIIAYAFSDETGKELESVELTSRAEESPTYTWPKDFVDLINSKSKYMRAGVKKSDGGFEGKWNWWENKLWRNDKDKNVRLFTTISHLDNWTDPVTLSSSRDLLAGGQSSVVVQVQSAGAKDPCETLKFQPAAGREGQYTWVADLCRHINKNSRFMRAGEKNVDTNFFDCLGSSSRNKLWIPVNSGLKASYQIIETPVIKPVPSLKAGDNDLLPDMTGFEPESLGNADQRWLSPGYLLADRDLNDGEKLRAWLINSADGKPIDTVEFIATATNRLKTQWPAAFSKAINSKAKQMKAGGWKDDGQFAALERAATCAEFAGQNLGFKAGINRLWHYSDRHRAFTTAAFRTNWVQALSLDNAGLNAADTFCVQVRDITTQYLYETHLFTPDAKKPLTSKTLCEKINSEGKMLRAGIWNTEKSSIAPGDKNNVLWIPQCSDLAVTLMAVNWWTQTTVNATRDLQDGESIYCYVLDDFSNAEWVPALRFTPKTAADRKKNAWLRAWATAIKASPLARYVRLGSSASGSSDPGENATQATLWQIGAPLRVFTTEPSPENWVSAAGPLADLYENNKTAVKIELRNGLTQGLVQAVLFKPSEALTKSSDKDFWLREFYKYLVSQLASLAYVRVGKVADTSGAEITSPVPAPMRVWIPRSSGIVVEVTRFSSSAEAAPAMSSKPVMITASDFKYTFTAQLTKRALVATVIAVAGFNVCGREFLISGDRWAHPVLLNDSIHDIFQSSIIPNFNLGVPKAKDWSDYSYRQSLADFVNIFIRSSLIELLVESAWGEQIEKLSNDAGVKKYISTYESYLRQVYDLVFSRDSVLDPRDYPSMLSDYSSAPVFDELSAGHQLIVYGGSAEPSFSLSSQAVDKGIRILSISPLPKYISMVGSSRLGSSSEKANVRMGIVIDLHIPDDIVLSEPFSVGRIGQVTSDIFWPSGRSLKMLFPQKKLAVPESPLCSDYGNTYRSEVFDVSGQNVTGVDPRTGFFNAHYPLAVLMGMEGKGPPCDLTLHYSALRANEAGLGDGWAFNFSSYETRSRLITLSTGQTIELTAADITQLRSKAVVTNRNCRISATFREKSDPKITDGIEMLTLEFPSGAKEVLSLPTGDKEEPNAGAVTIILAKLNEARAQIYKTKDKEIPQRTSTANLVGEVFSWIIWPVGVGITTNNSIRYNNALNEWEKRWAEKLPELVGPIDKEIAYWQRESRQLLPSTISSATGGSLQLQLEQRKGQFLLKKVSSNGKALLVVSYDSFADEEGNRLNEVIFMFWPDSEEIYFVKLSLQNYLLRSIESSDGAGGVLQRVSYGYSGDPTLDRILTSIEESDGSLEVASYECAAMKFPAGVMDKPPLPRVTRHFVQPGAGQASLITQWSYSSNNYLGANSNQSFSRLEDAAVQQGKTYTYDSTATETDGLSITRTWNGLHLQVKEQETAPSGVGKTTEWNFASSDPASPLFGLVTSINTTYQESQPAKESTK